MNVVEILNDNLLAQSFEDGQNYQASIHECQRLAKMYAWVENAIAVLSDLQSDKSYIYYGGMASALGLSVKHNIEEIDSIWEKEIYDRIHPDDLLGRHLLELQFFQLLKNLPISKRSDYHTVSKIRMRDRKNEYVTVQHRTFFLGSSENESLRLALCLYNFSVESTLPMSYEGVIVNSADGTVIQAETDQCNKLLSDREKEVLLFIEKGKLSKEIASSLSISINTVNRHRQNILEKLRVNNSIEALKVAHALKLI